MASRQIKKARDALPEEKRLVTKPVDFVKRTLTLVFIIVGILRADVGLLSE